MKALLPIANVASTEKGSFIMNQECRAKKQNDNVDLPKCYNCGNDLDRKFNICPNCRAFLFHKNPFGFPLLFLGIIVAAGILLYAINASRRLWLAYLILSAAWSVKYIYSEVRDRRNKS